MNRNLMAELTEGFDALAAERQGKITLKHHPVTISPAPVVTSEELLTLREKLKCLVVYLQGTGERMNVRWKIGSKGELGRMHKRLCLFKW